MVQYTTSLDIGMVTLVAAFIAAFVSIIGVVISIMSNSRLEHLKAQLSQRQELFQERRSFWFKQLSEFYDPIYILLSINGEITDRIGPNSTVRHDPDFDEEQIAKTWNELVKSVVIPNNLKICKIIETKLYLMNTIDKVEPYINFITHAQAYRVFRDQPYGAYRRFVFPKDFENHIQQQRLIIANQVKKYFSEKSN